MRIVLAGATGFLGRPLAAALLADGHRLVVLTRAAARHAADAGVQLVPWQPDGTTGPWASTLDGADAVVNLAGEPIAGRRWSAAQKAAIRSSRVNATTSIAEAIRRSESPPSVLINGSAVGYYGSRGDEITTESTTPGSDFLARVCAEWEAAAARALSARTRLVCLRTGLVIERGGGALAPMLLPFRLGLGGPIGSGRQYWSWIHRQDWIDLVRWAITTPGVSGAVNGTAPNPVTNAEFTRALGRALHRPAVLPAPAFLVRLALGEMADPLVLTGQRVVPARATELGFTFRYGGLEAALRAVFS